MGKDKTKIVINGPAVLRGKIKVSGSKNAVLPILAATLMTDEKCLIKNVPALSDINTMISMLDALGKKVTRSGPDITVEAGGNLKGEAPYDLVKKMRASILVMGAMVGRKRKMRIPLPGGCAIGTRPIDLHLKGLKRMGVKHNVSSGFVNLVSEGLDGTIIYLDYPSVGATENLIMAACHANGKTIIENTAREPEILQLIEFLKKMGVDIRRTDNTVVVTGRNIYKPVEFSVMDDRIQAGTYLIAGGIKNSEIEIDFSSPEVLESVIEKLTEAGVIISVDKYRMKIMAPKYLKPVEIRTSPYPGFPTDLQAPFTALLSVSTGLSVVSEEVFENRFLHCAELCRMGANIEIRNGAAMINGKKQLSGAPVKAMDLRGGAALIIAGLMARGKTEISGIEHIDRGYEAIVENLSELGANIWIE